MKTQAILLSFLLLFNAVETVRHNQIFRFLIDGRPKCINFFETTFMFTHVEIEVIKPIYKKDHAQYDCIHIFLFHENFTLTHVIAIRKADYKYL